VVFEAEYDQIILQKYSYDVTDHHYVTKITSQIFFKFGPLPIKIFGYASGARHV